MINNRIINYALKYKQQLIIGATTLILADIFGLLIPWLLKYPIDLLSSAKNVHKVTPFLIYILVAAVFQAIFRFSWRKSLYSFSRKVEFDLRNEYFSKLLYLPMSFFTKKKTGDIMSRATNDIKAVREFFGLGSLILVDATFTFIVTVTLMLTISKRLTLIALLPLPIITVAVFIFKGKIRERFKEALQKLSQVTSSVRESISGIRIIKSYVREKNEIERFSHLSKEYLEKNLNSARITAFFTPVFFLAIGLSYALTLWIGGGEVIKGKISIGSFVSFNGFLGILIWPMAAVGLFVNITQKAKASIGRIEQVISLKPYFHGESEAAFNDFKIFFKDIIISNLKFKFKEDLSRKYREEKNIIEIPDLKIKASEMTIIVGSIASGKSVFLKLLARIYDDFEGEISLGEKSIRKIPYKVLRENVAFVDQETFLFSLTIKENIILGNTKITNNEIYKILDICELHDEVKSFKNNIDTVIGEKGVNLSGGQKQRIAIARAIISSPKILIMDNPFSSLDSKTQKKIMKNLKEHLPYTTIVIVTHRLKAATSADTIHVLSNGRITESGTHSKLIQNDGVYKNLFKLQSLGIYG